MMDALNMPNLASLKQTKKVTYLLTPESRKTAFLMKINKSKKKCDVLFFIYQKLQKCFFFPVVMASKQIRLYLLYQHSNGYDVSFNCD